MEEGLGDRITQSLSPGNEIRDVVNADRDALAWGVLVWSGRVDLEPQRLCIGRNLYRIGRNDCCEIVLKEGSFDKDYLAGVSRRHLAVCRSDDGQSFSVRDLSRNGTYLNKRKMPKSSELPLRHGDRVGLFGRNDKHQMVFLSTSYMKPGVDEELGCRYILVESIDRGSFGEVTLALQRKTLSKFAVKSVRQLRAAGPHSPSHQIRNEANALRSLCHPCIVHIEEVISAPQSVYLVLEFMAGGNLLERINKSAPQMSERLVKFYFLQIALAVQYCHSKGVVHRDLKPENVLLSSYKDITVVKITDFGLCKLVGSGQGPVAMGTYCGTPLYLAPEVIRARMQRSRYSRSVDIWSLGVILFFCLSGYTPFTLQTSTRSLEKQILSGEFKYRAERWKSVSRDGYDLVRMMLNVDADIRPTMDQVLEHCWSCDADVRSSVDAVVFPVRVTRALCDTGDDDDFDDVPLSKRLRHI